MERDDTFDIDQELLCKILLDPKHADKQIKQLLKWNKANKPPMSIVKGQMLRILQKQDRLQKTAAIAHNVLGALITQKCNISILRAFLSLLKENIANITLDTVQSKPIWNKVPVDCLAQFLEVFGLDGHISQAEQHFFLALTLPIHNVNFCKRRQDAEVARLIKAAQFLDCFKLAVIFGRQENHIQPLLKAMTTNKAASKAADFIKKLSLDPEQYPQINQRLAKKCMRYFLKSQGWPYVQELYEDYPEVLGYAVEDLIHAGKDQQGITLYVRNLAKHSQQGKNKYIKKPDIMDKLNQKLAEGTQPQLIDNPLTVNCGFAPSDKSQLSLADYNITEADVIWIDRFTPNLKAIIDDMLAQPVLGFDTESLVGTTKLQVNKQGIALVQIASSTKIYLLDALSFTGNVDPILSRAFQHYFKDEDKIKVGHSVGRDLAQVCVLLGIQKQVERVIDVHLVFKGVYHGQKYSNLSYICKKMLGKEICKQQTLTNWKRRPLRPSQAHYAGMDAFCVLKIYDKLLETFGPQYLEHFVCEDEEDVREDIYSS